MALKPTAQALEVPATGAMNISSNLAVGPDGSVIAQRLPVQCVYGPSQAPERAS